MGRWYAHYRGIVVSKRNYFVCFCKYANMSTIRCDYNVIFGICGAHKKLLSPYSGIDWVQDFDFDFGFHITFRSFSRASIMFSKLRTTNIVPVLRTAVDSSFCAKVSAPSCIVQFRDFSSERRSNRAAAPKDIDDRWSSDVWSSKKSIPQIRREVLKKSRDQEVRPSTPSREPRRRPEPTKPKVPVAPHSEKIISGSGKYISPKGSVFEGEWSAGKLHGFGIATLMDGNTLEGQWQHGELHGPGQVVYPKGNTYVGFFEHGWRHGKGKAVEVDGTVWEGEWNHGKMHGQGKITYPDKTTVEGEFKKGYIYNGSGSLKCPPAGVYVGEWVNGKKHGKGQFLYHTGQVFEGEYMHGVLVTGRGQYVFKDGSVYEGEWVNDLQHGKGTLTAADGTVTKGVWVKGELKKNA